MKAAKVLSPGIVLGSYPEYNAPRWSWHAAFHAFWARLPLPARSTAAGAIDAIRSIQHALEHHSNEALQARVRSLRAHVGRDGFRDAHVREALATSAVLCGRTLNVAPYDTQLIAAGIMLDGHLVEMATGEGKTLAVALAASTAALGGIPVHVITANDYLVTRDATSLRPLYAALGLTVGAITPELDANARRARYACDITYCTAKELVFDYLRDRTSHPTRMPLEERAYRLSAHDVDTRLLRGLCLAIIDEADSVLIDEARVPLMLSRETSACDAVMLREAWWWTSDLSADEHFVVDATRQSARLTDAGRARLRSQARSSSWLSQRHCEDLVTLALTARYCLHDGRDYVIKDRAVTIVDPTTGRTAGGRAWSRGLHQFVELKEGIEPGVRTDPVVQITYQRFFARYLRLCGISGTLTESRAELARIYGKRVIPVPLRCTNRRIELPARVFTQQAAQYEAVLARVQVLQARGQPVLIGMDSVADSEALSRLLTEAGLRHAVLNARQDGEEACIVAAAGRQGAITVSTNMAGRGTDIVLGPGSVGAGGLHVISCQQNAARRMDRQLLGRCARGGDPGSYEVYIALDGPLLVRHWMARLLGACTRRAEMRYPWLGVQALKLAQRNRERIDRHRREWLMRRDEETGEWLAFSGREK